LFTRLKLLRIPIGSETRTAFPTYAPVAPILNELEQLLLKLFWCSQVSSGFALITISRFSSTLQLLWLSIWFRNCNAVGNDAPEVLFFIGKEFGIHKRLVWS
jgi:hypothetical protein